MRAVEQVGRLAAANPIPELTVVGTHVDFGVAGQAGRHAEGFGLLAIHPTAKTDRLLSLGTIDIKVAAADGLNLAGVVVQGGDELPGRGCGRSHWRPEVRSRLLLEGR